MTKRLDLQPFAESKSQIVEFVDQDDFATEEDFNGPKDIARRKAKAINAYMSCGLDWELALTVGKGQFTRKEVIQWLRDCPKFSEFINQGSFDISNKVRTTLLRLLRAEDEKVQLKAAEALGKAYDPDLYDSRYRIEKMLPRNGSDGLWELIMSRLKSADFFALQQSDPFLAQPQQRIGISSERSDDKPDT